MEIKTAVIGVGSMGKNHARLYAELPNVDFAAVSDTNSELAEQTARKYGVKAYSDYEKMLKAEQPRSGISGCAHRDARTSRLQSDAIWRPRDD